MWTNKKNVYLNIKQFYIKDYNESFFFFLQTKEYWLEIFFSKENVEEKNQDIPIDETWLLIFSKCFHHVKNIISRRRV